MNYQEELDLLHEEKLDRLLLAVEYLLRRIDAIEESARTEQLRGGGRSDWDRVYPDRPAPSRRARYFH